MRRVEAGLGLALKKVCEPQEVQIVRVVDTGIEALDTAGADVLAVRPRGLLIGLDRVLILADADVDVRRHVHEVPGGGCVTTEP